MATTYDAEVRVELIPKENTTLGDGTDIVTSIDSNIDKTIGGGITFSNIGTYNTLGSWHYYKSYSLTSTTYLNVIDAISGVPINPRRVLMIITAQDGASGARATIKMKDTQTLAEIEVGTLDGVGDFIFSPLADTGQDQTTDGIQFKTSTGYECTLDVFMWGG